MDGHYASFIASEDIGFLDAQDVNAGMCFHLDSGMEDSAGSGRSRLEQSVDQGATR